MVDLSGEHPGDIGPVGLRRAVGVDRERGGVQLRGGKIRCE